MISSIFDASSKGSVYRSLAPDRRVFETDAAEVACSGLTDGFRSGIM